MIIILFYLKGTVEVSGESDQLLLHRLADGTAVAVQRHAVHQQEAADTRRAVSPTQSLAQTSGFVCTSYGKPFAYLFHTGCDVISQD